MTQRAFLLWVVLCLAVAACAGGTPEQRAQWAADAARPLVCGNERDCAVKWARALEWVRANSDYPIRTYSRNIISTDRPKSYNDRPAYTVLRIANGDGTWRIAFESSCQGAKVCFGNPDAEQASFVNYVLAR